MKKNFLFLTDSYKLGHWAMKNPEVTQVRSYAEHRLGAKYPETLMFGLQGILLQHLVGQVVTKSDLDEAIEMSYAHLGENKINVEGWKRIMEKHHGFLPLRIRALKEGSIVPVGNCLFTIESTDPETEWLTQYVESILMKFWRPSTIATKARVTSNIIRRYVEQTSDNADFYKFAFHDFSYRSATTEEDAAISGAAILLSTMGTDTLPALKYAHDYYGASYTNLAFSCPATEHGVAMSFGPGQGEYAYVKHQLETNPHGIVSIVIDTNNTVNFIENVIPAFKDAILARRANSSHPLTKVVFRPDSPRFKGDYPEDQCLWIIMKLAEIFGHTPNSKGYKTLNPAVGCIYGDGLSQEDIGEIYGTLAEHMWDVQCQVVGQGGGALESKRDTQRMAIKPSEQMRNGVWEDVEKDPIDKSKKSKKGHLKVIKVDGIYQTINQHDPRYNEYEDELEVVFENGELKRFQTFEEIRQLSGF